MVNLSGTYRVVDMGESECLVWVHTGEYMLISAYLTPNSDHQSYVAYLKALSEILKKSNLKTILVGDFNAKSVLWGGHTTDNRGRELENLICEHNLTILNDGERPTLVRHNGESYIDVTLLSADVKIENTKWKVLEDESLSDHKYIVITISDIHGNIRIKYGKPDFAMFLDSFRKNIRGAREEADEGHTQRAPQKALRNSTQTLRNTADRTLYWWSGDLAESRKQVVTHRRSYTSARIRNNEAETERLRTEYKNSKTNFKNAISRAKRAKWIQLCYDLENDPFGNAYRIVRTQLKMPYPKLSLTTADKEKIFEDLFMAPAGAEERGHSQPKCPWYSQNWR